MGRGVRFCKAAGQKVVILVIVLGIIGQGFRVVWIVEVVNDQWSYQSRAKTRKARDLRKSLGGRKNKVLQWVSDACSLPV